MTDETKPEEKVSPNGQLVGLSALLNQLPPWAMNIVLAVVGLAASIEAVAVASPGLVPDAVVRGAHVIFAIAVVGGMASPGVRK